MMQESGDPGSVGASREGSHEGFDPDRYVVPVGYNDGAGGITVGSGFLGAKSGEVAFYTAAHVINGNQHPRRTGDWNGWTDRIGVYPRETLSKARELVAFTVTKPTAAQPYLLTMATPRFTWVVHGEQFLLDAVRFHPSQMKTLLAELQTQYAVIDLDNIADGLVAGQGIMCVGQPYRGDGVWPYFPPSRLGGPFIRERERHYQVDMASIPGYSGGPAFTDDGRFAGMVVGSNPEPGKSYEVARIIPAAQVRVL